MFTPCVPILTKLLFLYACQYGDGEKLVKAMFAVAKELQPSVVFMGISIKTLVEEPALAT